MRLLIALVVSALLAIGATAQADSKLIDFTSIDGRYFVKGHGKAKDPVKKTLAVGATGLAIPVVTNHWSGPNSTVLAVTYADYPETFREIPAKTIIDGVRDGLKGIDGKVALDEKITLGKDEDKDKVEGRELRIEASSKAAVRVRVFLVDTRLYQVMVTGSKENVTSKAATEFLDSFKLVK